MASASNVIRREDVGVVFSADIKRWGEVGGAFSYKVTKWETSVSIFADNIIR